MTTTRDTTTRAEQIGIEWHHAGFALAFGVGAAVLPPAGAVTVAGWVGGALGAMAAAIVGAGVIVLGVRLIDDWRPVDVPERAPDSRVRYAVFGTISLQLFVLGTALAAGLTVTTILLLVSPLNLPIAGATLADVYRLREHGVGWKSAAFGYAAGALLGGFLGGFAYWYSRGRRRARAKTA